MIKYLVDSEEFSKSGQIFNAKVQDCRFQLSESTLKLSPFESCIKVSHGKPPVKNAEHSL